MGVLLFREHLELLNKLPCEKRCEVLDALFAYSYDHVTPELDSLSELVFVAIRQSLDRNAEKYRIRCEKNREAALKRWHKEEKAEAAYEKDAKATEGMETETSDAEDANASYYNNSKKKSKSNSNSKSNNKSESHSNKKNENNHHKKESEKAEELCENKEDSPAPEESAPLELGTFGNVYLSEGDFERLKEKYPEDWEDKIDHLSCYMESSGKQYKSHLAVLLSWAAEDEKKAEAQNRYTPSPTGKSAESPPKIFRKGQSKEEDIFSDDIYEVF